LIHTNAIPAPSWLTQRYSLCYHQCSLFKSNLRHQLSILWSSSFSSVYI
jgi:hypothetical protein